MDKSIRRVEKLVDATNSALAQMKHSLMFDDLSQGLEFEGGKPRKKQSSGPKFPDGEDLRWCQDEFRSEADKVLARMDKLFGRRKQAKALERIKEINTKLITRKSDPPEMRQSRHKLQTLISQDLTPASKTSGDKPPALKLEKPPTPKESGKKSPAKSKELKTRILETQETVDRGFQTARQLSQKVESMSKKTPSESDAKRSDSSETLRSRCEKCAKRRRMKKMKKDKEVRAEGERKVKEDNVRVFEIKDRRVPNLSIQRLPSLHIKDGLRLQKVHELEIPASDASVAVNTANVIITHEGIEKEKRERELNQIRLNYLFLEDKSNYVECFNCGKLNRTRETRVDPRRVDDVLRMCNFNVFDPRIDEFVRRCNAGECIRKEEPIQNKSSEQTVIEKSHRKTRKLQEMSDYLYKLYKEEAESLEDNHLRLDKILQSLFRRVDESRELFEECCLLKRGTHRLTVTKPVTVSLDSTQKRMDKKDVKNRNKSRTQSPQEVKPVTSPGSTGGEEPTILLSPRPTDTFGKREQDEKGPPMSSNSLNAVKLLKPKRKPFIAIRNGSRSPKRIFRKSGKPLPKRRTTEILPGDVKSPFSTSSSSTSKKVHSSPKMRQLQRGSVIDKFKQSQTFSRKAEKEVSNYNNKSPEIGKTDHVTSLGEQSLPKESKFVLPLDSSFEKSESAITQPCDVKPETEKFPLSSSSEILKRPETKSPSPKLENSEDYESDFEGESELEVNLKLSTIIEVDSGAEKKQTTHSQGTTPSELVSSLKEILSALKDQFTRTETLADKLTENIQERKDFPKLWPTDSELVLNLQSARKDFKDTTLLKSPFSLVHSSKNRKSDDLSAGSLSEGGSSIGEVITKRKSDSTISENLPNGRRSPRVSSDRRDAIPFKLGLNDEVLYSEGEIPSNILVGSEAHSGRSVGEMPSEKASGTSSCDYNNRGQFWGA